MNISRVCRVVVCVLALTMATANAQKASGPEREGVVRHMHDHVDSVDDIRSAIIAGNLAGVREPAKWLASHEVVAGLPGGWEEFVAVMRSNARRIAGAQSLVAASYETGNLALACANCHRANNVQMDIKRVEIPPDELEDVATHMQRHRWAADRMWEGLYGPSEYAWNEGVDMLLDVALRPGEVAPGHGGGHGELGRLEREVHLIGSRGIVASTPQQRSQIYGEYLSLCASCHTTLKIGPSK